VDVRPRNRDRVNGDRVNRDRVNRDRISRAVNSPKGNNSAVTDNPARAGNQTDNQMDNQAGNRVGNQMGNQAGSKRKMADSRGKAVSQGKAVNPVDRVGADGNRAVRRAEASRVQWATAWPVRREVETAAAV
jgi:hypothetical protein